jgi:sigma-B regulation protein RsbQ
LSALRRNNVTVTGRGSTPLVFAHGFGCDQQMWRWVIPAFEDSHRIVLFDHVGAGSSDLSAYDRRKYGTLAGYADDLLEICDEQGLADTIFVGHSVSAMIGVIAAVRRPQAFSRLVLIGPSPRYINDQSYTGGFSRAEIDQLLMFLQTNHLGWAEAMAPVIMGAPASSEPTRALTDSFCRTDPAIARDFARVTFLSDNRADLPQVRTPALILQSQDDAIAPLAVGEYVHRQIPGSRLVVLDAVGHCPHMSAPEQTVAAIQAYLAEEGVRERP